MEQEFDLSVTPNAEIVRVHCSQYDEGTRKFIFHLYDDAQEFAIPAGATIELRATKADNKAYIINNITHPNIIAFSGNTITITSEKQMTAAAGDQDFKIRILTEKDTHDTALATARFTLVVDPDTINEDTDASNSVFPPIIDAARTSAAQAAVSATAAAASAESAESSKTSAAGSAISSETNVLKSEGYAVGKQNGSDVGDTSPYYQNNSKYYSDWAKTYANRTAEDAVSAHSDALAAKAQADRAKMYADFVEPHFLIANNRIYIRDDATGEFIVANNRLYMKLTTAV